jgi:large subunit ribosomal protein L18
MRKVRGKILNESLAKRYKRKLAIRKKVIGTTERPRICAIRSNKHLVVQVVDDSVSKTLFSVQTFGKTADKGLSNNKAGAKVIGGKVAALLKSNKIEKAVFDRGGFQYAGVIAELVTSIRENGIQI